MRITLALMLLVGSTQIAHAQKIMNFDKTVTVADPDIVIAPSVGEAWTLVRGSFALTEPLDKAVLTVYEQEGAADGLCVNIMRVGLSMPWVPIIGGYVADAYWGQLRGQDAPIIITWPNRLILHVGGLKQPVKAWVRFLVEK